MSAAPKRGPGRPRGAPRVRVPAEVPVGLVAVVKALAERRDITVAAAWASAARCWVLAGAPASVPVLADEDES